MNDKIDQYKINYVDYAEDMIKRYSKHREIVKNGNVDIKETNQSLSDYKAVNDFLIYEYEKKSLELDLKRSNFDQWYSEKYMESRAKLNPDTLAGTKWASTKEIDMHVRVHNKEEYRELNEELIILNREVATLRRLCDSYKRMDGIFQTLSANHRNSLKAWSIDNRMNTDYEEINSNNSKKNNDYDNMQNYTTKVRERKVSGD